MNGAVDFSNPYCVLQTNSEYEGHGVVSLEFHQLLGATHSLIRP